MQRNNGSKECAPIVCITIANQTSNRSQQYPLLWNWRTLIVKANCMFRSQLHLAQNQIFWNYNKYETEFKKKKHWNSFRYLAARHSLAWTMFLTYMIPLRSKKNNVPFARNTFISSFAPLTFVRQQFYGPVLPHASKFCLRPDKIPVYSKIVLVIATTERKCWVVQQNEIPFFFSFNLMCSSCIKNQPPTREEVACFFVLFMYWWLFHSS